MATETLKTGFYATENETFYVAPSGRVWNVSSPDFDGIRETDAVPADAIDANPLLTPEEAIGYCEQVEAESGEKLIETA